MSDQKVNMQYPGINASDPNNPNRLPFIIGVCGDFGGSTNLFDRKEGEDLFFPRVEHIFESGFTFSDKEFFDQIKPSITLNLTDHIGEAESVDIKLDFNGFDDFRPDQIFAQLENGPQAKHFAYYRDLKQTLLLLSLSPNCCQDRSKCADSTVTSRLKSIVSVEIDLIRQRIDDQICEILHNERFLDVEASWRGIAYFMQHVSPRRESVILKVCQISKDELLNDCQRSSGNLINSKFYESIITQNFHQRDAIPFGLLVGAYEFGSDANDIQLLQFLARIMEISQTVFATGASPRLLNFDAWGEVEDISQGRLEERLDQNANPEWNAFRNNVEGSRYVAMCLPRFLGRARYGVTNPCGGYPFQERFSRTDSSERCWINAAFAFAMIVGRAFDTHRWCTLIRGVLPDAGGVIRGLPRERFSTELGQWASRIPLEIALSESWVRTLSKNGFCALYYLGHRHEAALLSAPSIKAPRTIAANGVPLDNDTLGNEIISVLLPYIFASARIWHHVYMILNRKIGDSATIAGATIAKEIDGWINGDGDEDSDGYIESGTDFRTAQPLKRFKIDIDDSLQDGVPKVDITVVPHLQLEDSQIEVWFNKI